MSTVIPHPSRVVLTAYSAGRISEAETGALEIHLDECPECRKFLDALPPSRVEKVLKTAVASRRRGWSQDLPAIPGYEVLHEIGHGGMGVVYKARHQRTNQEVAIKLMRADLAAVPAIRARFHRADVLTPAHLSHPNIVRVTDAGDVVGIPYVVLEYIEGKTLTQIVKDDGPLPVATVCAIARKVASALQYLHEHKIAHRDIKPANIMVTADGEVKILDLGLARETGRPVTDGDLTEQGALLGTLRFMAPEQALSSHVDSRADIYSLGQTIYWLLAGQVPFPDLDGLDLLMAHREKDPVPVSKLRAGVPSWLLAVLKKMTAKQPRKRYQTPAEVEAAIAGAGRSLPWVWTRRVVAAVVVLAPLAGSALKFVPLSSTHPEAASAVTVAPAAEPEPEPENVRLTKAAWSAYKEAERLRKTGNLPEAKQHYERALALADECVQEFLGRAEEAQKALEDDKLAFPKDGKLDDKTERKRVFDRGPLNDAGTCLWVRGRCLARLGRLDEARKLYEAAGQLSYAMCWDKEQDLFWSPARKAQDDLKVLDRLPIK